MNSKIFIIILFVLAGAVIFGTSVKQKQETSTNDSSKIETNEQTTALFSQSKTMGAVEVEVKPVSISMGQGKDIVFEVSMNTHSVELNYDYTQIATLSDDRGNSYKPTQWTGGNSGHHLKGELIFAPFPENTKQLTLTLDGVDNKSEDLTWQL